MSSKTVLIAILSFIVVVILVLTAFLVIDYMDKQRCMNMSFTEMTNDRSCDEYWRQYKVE